MQSTNSINLGTYSREHLGDALCCSPLPRLLNQRHGVQVYAPGQPTARSVFRNNPFVSGFGEAGTPLCGMARGDGHVIQRILQAFELPIDLIPKPEIYLSRNERGWAARQRRLRSRGRPLCVLSPGAVTDSDNLRSVDWPKVVKELGRRYRVVQPVFREPVIPGVVPYRALHLRRYMALISVADLFVGGTSGGSHVAAAFNIPSLIVIWRELEKELRFPVSGVSIPAWGIRFKASFLYPQHWFICSEELTTESFNHAKLAEVLKEIATHGKAGRPTAVNNNPVHPCGFAPEAPRQVVRTSSGRFLRIPTTYGSRINRVIADAGPIAEAAFAG